MRTLCQLFGLVALASSWNLPNHYPPWTSFHGELLSAVGLALLFASAALVPKPARAVPSSKTLAFDRATTAWLLVASLPLLQFAFGQLTFKADATLGWLYAAGVALAIYTGSLWAVTSRPGEALKSIYIAIVFGAIAAGGLALAQWFRLGAGGWWAMDLIDSRPFGNLAQPNHFGLLMVIGLVALTALFDMAVVASKVSYWFTAAFLSLGVAISQSRAAALALATLVVIWWITSRQMPTRLKRLEVTLALAVFAILYVWLDFASQLLLVAAPQSQRYLEAGPRIPIWLNFLLAIGAQPWLGYGFDQGAAALAQLGDRGLPGRNTIFAHNVVLDLMTWVGVPLGLALVVSLGRWILAFLRPLSDAFLQARRREVFAVWLALAVQSLFEYPFAYAYFLIPAALLGGAVSGRAVVQAGVSPVPTFRASGAALTLAGVAAVVLGIVTRDYFDAEAAFRTERFVRANFVGRQEATVAPPPLILDHLAAYQRTASIAVRSGMSPSEIEQLRVVARRFHFLPSRIDFAKALALNGRVDEANAQISALSSLYHPDAFVRIKHDWQAWLAAH